MVLRRQTEEALPIPCYTQFTLFTELSCRRWHAAPQYLVIVISLTIALNTMTDACRLEIRHHIFLLSFYLFFFFVSGKLILFALIRLYVYCNHFYSACWCWCSFMCSSSFLGFDETDWDPSDVDCKIKKKIKNKKQLKHLCVRIFEVDVHQLSRCTKMPWDECVACFVCFISFFLFVVSLLSLFISSFLSFFMYQLVYSKTPTVDIFCSFCCLSNIILVLNWCTKDNFFIYTCTSRYISCFILVFFFFFHSRSFCFFIYIQINNFHFLASVLVRSNTRYRLEVQIYRNIIRRI